MTYSNFPLTDWFEKGSRVKQKDPDDGKIVFGTVTFVEPECMWILWDDFTEDCKHDNPDDLETIKQAK